MTATHGTDHLSWATTPVPAARAMDNFSAAEVGGEEYVFLDNELLEYHTLNRPAFAVWQLCDGRRTCTDIAAALARTGIPLPVEAVELAVAELGEAGLLESAVDSWGAKLTRRRVVKLTAAGALGAAVIPVVSSITAPVAATTTSCSPGQGLANGTPCGCSAECASTCCSQSGPPGSQTCQNRNAGGGCPGEFNLP
jgi:hypothetical protein